MKNIWLILVVSILSFVILGCTAENQVTLNKKSPAVVRAIYTKTAVTVDGRLDEEVWRKAEIYKMNLADDRAAMGLEEGGEVRCAWDDEFFYVGIKFQDSDIIAEGRKDQLMHFNLGDLCELFLKPANQTWYWELYVTPLSKKSTFWFPGRGRLGLPSNFVYDCGLKVAAKNIGTVNNWDDRDKYWTAEMAMPIKDLSFGGEKFGPGTDWRILVARYNYSRYLKCKGAELTMTPKLSETNYHFLEEYGILKLVK